MAVYVEPRLSSQLSHPYGLLLTSMSSVAPKNFAISIDLGGHGFGGFWADFDNPTNLHHVRLSYRQPDRNVKDLSYAFVPNGRVFEQLLGVIPKANKRIHHLMNTLSGLPRGRWKQCTRPLSSSLSRIREFFAGRNRIRIWPVGGFANNRYYQNRLL